MREAMQQERGPLFIAAVADTRLDDIATGLSAGLLMISPASGSRWRMRSIHAPPAVGLIRIGTGLLDVHRKRLKAAERPLVISGMGCGDKASLRRRPTWHGRYAIPGTPAELCFVVPECNSLGAAMLGGASLEQRIWKQ